MAAKERESGIEAVGKVPWGTHFGLFYRTKQDLVDVLVPYFKAGLENGEFCMWVTAEPLDAGEAIAHMAEAMPDFEAYKVMGQIEVILYTEWYKINGVFDPDRVLDGWVEKLRKARERGFGGLRLAESESWVGPGTWKDFTDYEQTLNDVIGQYAILAACSYPLEKCGADDILDVVGTHHFALTKRNGGWKIIEDQGQKNARKELQESRAHLKSISRAVPAGIGVVVDRIIREANDRLCEMTGYTKEELLGKNARILYPSDEDYEYVGREKYAQIDRLGTGAVETRWRRKDGRVIDVLLSSTPLEPDDPGAGVTFTALDITKRKRAEERIKNAYDYYYFKLFDDFPNPIWRADTDGKCDYFNKSWLEFTGRSLEQELGDGWAENLHPDDTGCVVGNYLKAFNAREPFVLEYRLGHADGSYHTIIDFGKPFYDMDGKFSGYIGSCYDITERKRTEKALEHAKAQA